MHYVEREAPPRLKEQIRCLWSFRGAGSGMLEPIVPDGCAELILHLGTPYSEMCGTVPQEQPRALIAGQLTRPLHLVATGPVDVLAVRFEPHGARRFVGRPMKDMTDKRCPLADLFGHQVAGDLLGTLSRLPTADARFEAAAAFVDRMNGPPPLEEAAVANAVRRIAKPRGRVRAEELAKSCELSLRTLERRFADVVGVSPRALSSIFRVRSLFDELRADPTSGLTQLALAANWFDHSQMTRDFKRFVGCTPSAFLAGAPGLAAGLATGDADGLAGTYKRKRSEAR